MRVNIGHLAVTYFKLSFYQLRFKVLRRSDCSSAKSQQPQWAALMGTALMGAEPGGGGGGGGTRERVGTREGIAHRESLNDSCQKLRLRQQRCVD